MSALKCKRVVVGHDMRESAETFEKATIRGLIDQGADVVPIGLTSTPMYYFAVNHLKGDAGVKCSASHNPAEYNGYKMTGPGAIPSIAIVDNDDALEDGLRRATSRTPEKGHAACRRWTCWTPMPRPCWTTPASATSAASRS